MQSTDNTKALVQAIRDWDYKKVQSLITTNYDKDYNDPNHGTLLYMTLTHRLDVNFGMLETLIKDGIDVNVKCTYRGEKRI